MEYKVKENIIECWVYDKFYRNLPATHNFGTKKERDELKEQALKGPFPNGITVSDHGMIRAQINHDYKHKHWRRPPEPIDDHVKSLFPQWKSWGLPRASASASASTSTNSTAVPTTSANNSPTPTAKPTTPPVTPAAPAAISATSTAKPTTSTTKSTTSTAKPAAPAAKSTTSTAKATTSTAKPAAPTAKPTAPATKPAAPATKPAAPATKPAAPATKPTTSTAKPAAPAAKTTTSTAEATTSTAKPAAPTAKPTAPATKPAAPATKPTTSTAKPAAPTAKPATSTAKPATSTAKPATSTAKPATSTAKPTTPISASNAAGTSPSKGTPASSGPSTQSVPVVGKGKQKAHIFRNTGFHARVITNDMDADGEEIIETETDPGAGYTDWNETAKALRAKKSLFPSTDNASENSGLEIAKMISLAPLFTGDVFDTNDDTNDFLGDNLQFSTFARVRRSELDIYSSELAEDPWGAPLEDDGDREATDNLYLNTNTAWTTFICGLQGAGKSHTLSVVMENCLIPNKEVGVLKQRLAALVCSYSPFTPIGSGKPCEVAYLATPDPASGIGEGYGPRCVSKVTVLASRSNFDNMKKIYEKIPGVTVRQLLLKPSQLTVKTMLNLMSVQDDNNALYMQVVTRILREMSAEDQNGFNYMKFKEILALEQFTQQQWQPLELRLELLESFLGAEDNPDPFDAKPGTITIVDLTCPFVDAEIACLLFSICVDLFCASKGGVGKIVALDEAHKFMTTKAASQKFAESIIQNIRLQRHIGLRTIISTQDPDVHPQLLELSNFILMHRFDSPRWFEIIRKYVGFAVENQDSDAQSDIGSNRSQATSLFEEIMVLNPGEAMLYCPQLVTTESVGRQATLLKSRLLKILVRRRLTKDGGVTRTALGNPDL
ncbi:hypothetical protein TWF694_005192 [Orbilia ellipsospora]|uniref:P-loop containing nucleoside triphosphate hydrolase n=1 Tax=Orbilia ellipsospora TaxID=2528407 RepID=A0AAV9WV08_9PEZI